MSGVDRFNQRADLALAKQGVLTDKELLSIDDLRDAWNAQSDAFNSWDDLGIDEIIWFAQQQAIARYAPLAQPEPEIEPAAYLHRQGNYTEASEMSLSEDEKARGWTEEPLFHHPLAQPEPADLSGVSWPDSGPITARAVFADGKCYLLDTQPEPESAFTHLAARPLLERVARMADCIDQRTVGEIIAISNQAEVWLSGNPPGQPVAIEPRGCPTPGACSCVEPATQPEPEGPTDEDLDVDHILRLAEIIREVDGSHDKGAAALAEAILSHPGSRWSPAIQPVAVAERLPEAEDCAPEGTKHVGCCWQVFDDGLPHWALAHRDWAAAGDATHWLPYHALSIPQPTQPHET
jgi:hypothetical protein